MLRSSGPQPSTYCDWLHSPCLLTLSEQKRRELHFLTLSAIIVPVRGTPWPSLSDFCCFRHRLKSTCLANHGTWPKTAEIDQGAEGQSWVQGSVSPPLHLYTAITVEPCLQHSKGQETCLFARSKPPSILSAQNSVFQNRNGKEQPGAVRLRVALGAASLQRLTRTSGHRIRRRRQRGQGRPGMQRT